MAPLLRLFLTDVRCSDLARIAASKLRVLNFSEYEFVVYDAKVDIYKVSAGVGAVTTLNFLNSADLADFVPAALRNCVFGKLALCYKHPADAMGVVANLTDWCSACTHSSHVWTKLLPLTS